LKAETIIRDLFKARTSCSMNEMRETFLKREEQLGDVNDPQVHEAMRGIQNRMKDGDKVNFWRAYEHQAGDLAAHFGVTTKAAKRMMSETFRREAGGELYDWGKTLDEEHYCPQIEAERKAREERSQARDGGPSRGPARGYGRPNGRFGVGLGPSRS
jgi:hypothetical protein